MGLFKADLYRNFAIGFLIGAVMIGVAAVPEWDAELASPAMATTGEDVKEGQTR